MIFNPVMYRKGGTATVTLTLVSQTIYGRDIHLYTTKDGTYSTINLPGQKTVQVEVPVGSVIMQDRDWYVSPSNFSADSQFVAAPFNTNSQQHAFALTGNCTITMA